MQTCIQIDVKKLFELWADEDLTHTEVARALGVTSGRLTKLAAQYGLKRRPRRHRAHSMVDPTPEEIAERAMECRLRHLAEKKASKYIPER